MAADTALRPLYSIARDIQADPALKGNARDWSRPYLDAMRYLSTTADHFGNDDGESVVAYALSNLNYYRGPKAKALKAELKAHLGRK